MLSLQPLDCRVVARAPPRNDVESFPPTSPRHCEELSRRGNPGFLFIAAALLALPTAMVMAIAPAAYSGTSTPTPAMQAQAWDLPKCPDDYPNLIRDAQGPYCIDFSRRAGVPPIQSLEQQEQERMDNLLKHSKGKSIPDGAAVDIEMHRDPPQ